MFLAALLLNLAPAPAEPAAPASLRRECFVLEDPARSAGADPLGWAEFLRREDEHGMVLECEYVFLRPQPAGRWRVRHVEQLDDTGPRLVWREIGSAAGRTLTLEREGESGAWRCQAWERDERVQCSLDTRGGAVFPLYLLELARQGHLAAAELRVFDPLESALVPRRLTTVYAPASGSRARRFELARPDGTLAGRWSFEGAQLLGFQLQEGGAIARRIEPEEYTRAVGNVVDLAGPRAEPATCSDSAK